MEKEKEKEEEEKDKKDTIKKIEEDASKKIKGLTSITEAVLINIMKEGEKEFVEKMGRTMTYAEMRSAYG
jgi:hypothetical protein